MYDNKAVEKVMPPTGYDYNQNIPVNEADEADKPEQPEQPKHLEKAEEIAKHIMSAFDETCVNEMITHIKYIVVSEREVAIAQLEEYAKYLKESLDNLNK